MRLAGIGPVALLISLALAAGSSASAPGSENRPPRNGAIAFVRMGSWPYFRGDIYRIDPNGHGLRNLTHHKGYYQWPTWSPDGRQIAYWANEGLFTMNARGGERHRLTASGVVGAGITWSPSGSKIAYAGAQGGLYVIGASGGGSRQLASFTFVHGVSWSPDGARIAFSGNRAVGRPFHIYVIGDAGGPAKELTNAPGGRYDEDPSWSPDGTRIAFSRSPHLGVTNGDLFVMRADGSGVRRLTQGGQSTDPVWSPDGQELAFTRPKSTPKFEFLLDLRVMKADGTRKRRLTHGFHLGEGFGWQRLR